MDKEFNPIDLYQLHLDLKGDIQNFRLNQDAVLEAVALLRKIHTDKSWNTAHQDTFIMLDKRIEQIKNLDVSVLQKEYVEFQLLISKELSKINTSIQSFSKSQEKYLIALFDELDVRILKLEKFLLKKEKSKWLNRLKKILRIK